MSISGEVRAASGSLVDDYDEIRDVVQLCLEGEAKGDVTQLQRAFHPDARMFGGLAGTRYDAPIQALFDMAAERPADTGNYRSRILSIHHVGDAATATVAEGLLGNRVVRRLLLSVPHRWHMEDRQQDVRACGRRSARLTLLQRSNPPHRPMPPQAAAHPAPAPRGPS